MLHILEINYIKQLFYCIRANLKNVLYSSHVNIAPILKVLTYPYIEQNVSECIIF
jgi:hypothetical protein